MAGRKQPEPFNPERASLLDDPERERWLPTARIVELLDAREGMRVLDYGAGTGRYTIAAARAYPNAEVVAFDIAQKMLDIIAARIAESGMRNVRTAGPEQSAIEPGSFNRAFGVHILHEIDDEHVEHVFQALEPGGSFLVVDWDRDRAAERAFGPPPDHVHTKAEALDRLCRAGFTPELLQTPEFPYHFAIRATR